MIALSTGKEQMGLNKCDTKESAMKGGHSVNVNKYQRRTPQRPDSLYGVETMSGEPADSIRETIYRGVVSLMCSRVYSLVQIRG